MEAFQENRPGVALIAKEGEVLCREGELASILLILKKGKVQYTKKIHDKVKFNLFSVNAPAVLNGSFFLKGSLHGNSVEALTDCELSGYAFNQDKIRLVLKQKSNILVLFVRSLFRDLISLVPLVLEGEELKNTLDSYLFNMTLLNSKLRPDKYIMSQISSKLSIDKKPVGNDEKIKEDVEEELSLWEKRTLSDYYKLALEQKNGEIDILFTTQFLHTPWLERLKLTETSKSEFLSKDFPFLRSFFQLSTSTLTTITKESPNLLLQISDKSILDYYTCLQRITEVAKKNWENASIVILGNESWTLKLEEQVELFHRGESLLERSVLLMVLNYFLELYSILEKSFFHQINIQSRLQSTLEQHRATLNNFISNEVDVIESDQKSKDLELRKELHGLFFKILQWAKNFSKEQTDQLYEQLVILRDTKNPFDNGEKISKSRKVFTQLYWELYKHIAVIYVQESNLEKVPRYIKLFLNYGILDEEFLEFESIKEIYYFQDANLDKYPVYSPIEWLSLIASSEISPSINSLGMTYLEFLNVEFLEILKKDSSRKDDGESVSWKKIEDVPEEVNTLETRVHFEIENTFKVATRISSGSLLNHLPMLTKHHFSREIKKVLVAKKDFVESLDKLLAVDFSAFHREVSYENIDLNIQRQKLIYQIIPNFIMLPSFGTTPQFWQEREGRDRVSKGRIFCNKMSNLIDLYDNVIRITAIYRWEIIKVVLGYDWNNIGKPSLTADYIAYLQFFKDNRLLSADVKRKIAGERKRLRSDKKMFVADYFQWIKNESQGNQVLNKVLSSFFVKNIPLTKELCKNLSKLPRFEKDINRFQNIMRQKVERYASLLKAIMAAGIEPPKELLETYHYYKLDI